MRAQIIANSGIPVAGFLSTQLCPACFRFTPLCTSKSFINRPNAIVFCLSPRMRECPTKNWSFLPVNMVLVSAWLPIAFPVSADWTTSNPHTCTCNPPHARPLYSDGLQASQLLTCLSCTHATTTEQSYRRASSLQSQNQRQLQLAALTRNENSHTTSSSSFSYKKPRGGKWKRWAIFGYGLAIRE